MAKEIKKDTVKSADTGNVGTQEGKFSKQQILASAMHANRRDLLMVLLEDEKEYTLAEVGKIMDDWMKKGAK